MQVKPAVCSSHCLHMSVCGPRDADCRHTWRWYLPARPASAEVSWAIMLKQVAARPEGVCGLVTISASSADRDCNNPGACSLSTSAAMTFRHRRQPATVGKTRA